MKEFVNLEEEQPIECKLKPKISIIEGSEGSEISVFNIPKQTIKIDTEDEEEHICIKDDCDVSKYYGCTDQYDGFKKENLFSELTDEYQRAIARLNLGIPDSLAFIWGNIKGNIFNQKDLYEWVTTHTAEEINEAITNINKVLDEWAYQIKLALKNKADIYSPNFQGIPTVPLPSAKDNSNQIASTEWVNARIEATDYNKDLKYFRVSPQFRYVDETSVNVTVEWDYKSPIISQSINGQKLDINDRQFVFENVTKDMVILLNFTTAEGSYVEVYSFETKYPIYYGTNKDITSNSRTFSSPFVVTAGEGEFIYIGLPNNDNAQFSVSGIIGGFILDSSIELHNTIYYIYKSVNPNLGETSITLHSVPDSTVFDQRLQLLEEAINRLNNLKFIALEND